MASLYDGVAQRSLATITRKGAAVTFPGSGGTAPTYDPATDTWSGGTPASSVITGRAVQIDGNPDRFKALELILVNPVTLMIAASGLGATPVPGMAFTWASVTYTIKDVESVAPDGTPILWIVTGST